MLAPLQRFLCLFPEWGYVSSKLHPVSLMLFDNCSSRFPMMKPQRDLVNERWDPFYELRESARMMLKCVLVNIIEEPYGLIIYRLHFTSIHQISPRGS